MKIPGVLTQPCPNLEFSIYNLEFALTRFVGLWPQARQQVIINNSKAPGVIVEHGGVGAGRGGAGTQSFRGIFGLAWTARGHRRNDAKHTNLSFWLQGGAQ
jgi:hypothetical protein